MGLEQLNRLQSVQATMSINPGNEEGYGSTANMLPQVKRSNIEYPNRRF